MSASTELFLSALDKLGPPERDLFKDRWESLSKEIDSSKYPSDGLIRLGWDKTRGLTLHWNCISLCELCKLNNHHRQFCISQKTGRVTIYCRTVSKSIEFSKKSISPSSDDLVDIPPLVLKIIAKCKSFPMKYLAKAKRRLKELVDFTQKKSFLEKDIKSVTATRLSLQIYWGPPEKCFRCNREHSAMKFILPFSRKKILVTCSSSEPPVALFSAEDKEEGEIIGEGEEEERKGVEEEKEEERASYQLFQKKREDAESAGREWGLTFHDWLELVSQACYYCGLGGGGSVRGLDRKNSALGYSLSNVVPACWPCNRSKGAREVEDFIQHCVKIAEKHSQK